jgi:hypothetical protein
MSILIEALNELDLSAANYVPGARAAVSTVDGWELIKSGHGGDREGERNAGGVLDELTTRIIKRLNQIVMKITRSGEYLFFSKSLNRGAVCNVDTAAKQLRIVTVLPAGKDFAKPGTKQVIIEGVQYEMIEID